MIDDQALLLSAALAPVALAAARADGVIVAANPAWATTTGWAPEDVIGRRLHDLVTTRGRLFLETHCLPILYSAGTVDEAAIEIVGPDGERIPVLLHARRDAATGDLQLALTAARERRAQQDELRRMRARERHNNDLQAFVARLRDQALAGVAPDELAALSAVGLRELLPAELVTVIEPGDARLVALAGDVERPPHADVAAEIEASVARFAGELCSSTSASRAGSGRSAAPGAGVPADPRRLARRPARRAGRAPPQRRALLRGRDPRGAGRGPDPVDGRPALPRRADDPRPRHRRARGVAR